MKKYIPSMLALFIAISTTTTLSFAQAREERKVHNFSSVDAGGSFEVFLKKGNSEKIVIEAQSGPIDKIVTEVAGQTLKIYVRDHRNNYNFKNVKIYITFRQLEAIAGSGSGNLRIESALKSQNLRLSSSGSGSFYAYHPLESIGEVKISNSGSGSMKIQSSLISDAKVSVVNSGSGRVTIEKIEAQDLSINNSGSGGMDIHAGKTNNQVVVLSGSGSFNSQDLESKTCDIRKSGSGSVYVNAREELKGSSSGSGNIYLKESGARLNVSSSGSGKIKSIN